tara:strand:+ start:561 stop:1901 length:1341 start_codon:yes stop_codon:yes gene_type:complete
MAYQSAEMAEKLNDAMAGRNDVATNNADPIRQMQGQGGIAPARPQEIAPQAAPPEAGDQGVEDQSLIPRESLMPLAAHKRMDYSFEAADKPSQSGGYKILSQIGRALSTSSDLSAYDESQERLTNSKADRELKLRQNAVIDDTLFGKRALDRGDSVMFLDRLKKRIDAGDGLGHDMTESVSLYNLAQTDIGAAKKRLDDTYMNLVDRDLIKGISSKDETGSKVHKVIPYPDGTTQSIFKSGKVITKNAAGDILEGQEATDAIDASLRMEVIQAGRVQKEKSDAGESSQFQTLLMKDIRGVVTNIGNIDDAILKVEQGANTGPIRNLLPNITTASIELKNIQSRLGLDIIGSVTFGALSEEELKLAMNTALPGNLTPPALIQWLKDKRSAQRNVQREMLKAAVYLNQPGNNIGGYLATQQAIMEEKEKEKDNGTGKWTYKLTGQGGT